MILAGGVGQRAGVAFIFPAEQALRILRGLGLAGSGDGLGVLLRLGQVDRDVDVAVGRRGLPADILLRAVAADIVGVLAELVVPVGRLRGRYRVFFAEHADHLGRARHKAVHEAGVEEVAGGDAVLDDAAGNRFVKELFQGLLKIHILVLFRGLLVVFLAEAVEEKVCRIGLLALRQKTGFAAVSHELFDR